MRISDNVVFSLNGSSIQPTPILNIKEKEAERMEEPGDGEMCYKKMLSGYGIVFELNNSLQLWLPAEDLHRIGPASILSWKGKG